jgi:hypothetical protein
MSETDYFLSPHMDQSQIAEQVLSPTEIRRQTAILPKMGRSMQSLMQDTARQVTKPSFRGTVIIALGAYSAESKSTTLDTMAFDWHHRGQIHNFEERTGHRIHIFRHTLGSDIEMARIAGDIKPDGIPSPDEYAIVSALKGHVGRLALADGILPPRSVLVEEFVPTEWIKRDGEFMGVARGTQWAKELYNRGGTISFMIGPPGFAQRNLAFRELVLQSADPAEIETAKNRLRIRDPRTLSQLKEAFSKTGTQAARNQQEVDVLTTVYQARMMRDYPGGPPLGTLQEFVDYYRTNPDEFHHLLLRDFYPDLAWRIHGDSIPGQGMPDRICILEPGELEADEQVYSHPEATIDVREAIRDALTLPRNSWLKEQFGRFGL